LIAGFSGPSFAPDKAVVWSSGQPLALGTFGGAWSAANGCSSSGLVAGWAQVEPDSNRFHGFVHDGTTLHDVGLLPGGVVTDMAAVNASGVAVGIAQTIEGHFHAIIADPTEGMLDLGTLGGLSSEATAISDAGHVTGRAQTGARDNSTFEGIVRHAFLWHRGKMIDLGTLPATPDGLIESHGWSVNSRGQVVGEAHNASLTVFRPFRWSEGVMTDLNDLLPANSGWVLRSARAINESRCGGRLACRAASGRIRAARFTAPLHRGAGAPEPVVRGSRGRSAARRPRADLGHRHQRCRRGLRHRPRQRQPRVAGVHLGRRCGHDLRIRSGPPIHLVRRHQ
jgi:probable HAF family extracellular repeat protein